MKTIAAVFPSAAEAVRALHDLERIGVPSEDISIIAGNDPERHEEFLEKARKAEETPESAALSGASIGGGIGLVATLLTLTIPGIGPMMVMGPLATVFAGGGVGAAGGALIRAFFNMGIHHEEAPLYEEAVRRGAIMLTATVDDPLEAESVMILQRHNGRNIHDEADTWKGAGWKPVAHPYPSDDTFKSEPMGG